MVARETHDADIRELAVTAVDELGDLEEKLRIAVRAALWDKGLGIRQMPPEPDKPQLWRHRGASDDDVAALSPPVASEARSEPAPGSHGTSSPSTVSLVPTPRRSIRSSPA